VNNRPRLHRRPEVAGAREFLEISRDFTDPREAIREAISNAIDWGAKEIRVTIKEDRTRADEELIIEIEDNGIGLDQKRLHAFFDLGRSIAVDLDEADRPIQRMIGYKGHGTKTYFNSRQIEVDSDSPECTVYAIMDFPLDTLMANKIPEYEYVIEEKSNEKTFTKITIRGYNMSRNKRDFDHPVLKDYILWFTQFGSVEKEFEMQDSTDKVLFLQGLGRDDPERIEFGHRFPLENPDIAELEEGYPGEWAKIFVKRWKFEHQSILDHPGKFIDMVFYIEGDEAKRSYNPMIRPRLRGRPRYGTYKVEERYGLWVCKDYIPIKRYNEWLGLGKRMETKYHAFVNCQEFRLTANRSDIGNTPPDFLSAVAQTVKQIYEEEIIGNPEYQEYEGAVELAKQYQTAKQERKDFDRRRRRVMTKKICEFKGVELIEPGVEMGVVALFNQIYAIEPSLFQFHVIDYDTRRGYDALVSQAMPHDLSKESIYFIEFKHRLTDEFNHSFDHLVAIICWDCNLSEGTQVTDIKNKRRELRITQPSEELKYTRYMLVSPRERHNIEVFVLKDYLREKLGIEFRLRPKKS
jgi:hypothetical protein